MISQLLSSNRYLMQERKLSEETIRTWHLGYIDHFGECYVDADFQGTLPSISQTMRHGTMFPVFDLYNNCVAISVRPLALKSNSPKYINSVYEKANHLFGLNFTYRDILRTQKVYVAEGNLSAITPWQNGLKNIVALLGINISHTQLCLLNRFAKQVCFMVDADKAGENFIKKMREQIPAKYYDSDLKFTFVQLPKGQDPDSYFQNHTLQEFLSIPEQELFI